MPETTRLVDRTELVGFGQHLNELHHSDLVFEMPDAHRRMTRCSLDDVIARFQTFFDGKSESFKVRMTFNEGRPGMMCKTIEYSKGPVTNDAA
jgi:hypothetical protein